MNEAEKAMKKLTAHAVAEFHKWEGEKNGDKTPLVDVWVEAFILGYVSAMLDERRGESDEESN